MTSNTRLAELSTLIQEKTAIVDAHIKEKNLPAPSFDASYPPLLDLPDNVAAARLAALEAMDELEAHLRGPANSLYYKLIHVRFSGSCIQNFTDQEQSMDIATLHIMAKYHLAETFPLDGTSTVEDIAKKSGLDKTDCERIIRHLISHRLLSTPKPGRHRTFCWISGHGHSTAPAHFLRFHTLQCVGGRPSSRYRREAISRIRGDDRVSLQYLSTYR